MQLRWVMHERVPKPGMEKKFEWLSQATPLASVNRESFNNELCKISLSPKEFDGTFDTNLTTIDGGRVYTCPLLSPALRENALRNQTAIGAHDYGIRLMRVVRILRRDIAARFKASRTFDTNTELVLAKQVNFLQVTGRWLITWGGRGFGFRSVKE